MNLSSWQIVPCCSPPTLCPSAPSAVFQPLLSSSVPLVFSCALLALPPPPPPMICSFLDIRSFGRHEICSIYHISHARRKSINSSIASLKRRRKKGLKPRNNCTGLCFLQFFFGFFFRSRTNLPSFGCRSSEGKWEKACVLSEQTWLAGL